MNNVNRQTFIAESSIYSKHILAVNTTSTLAGGTYTVTATGGQEATGSFSLKVSGMCPKAHIAG